MKNFTVSVEVKNPGLTFPVCFFPPFLLFSLLPLSSPRLLPSCFFFFHSEVCKISRGIQHRRHETHLQEGVHHPSAQETSYPPAVGGLWGAAGWVWTADTMKLTFFLIFFRSSPGLTVCLYVKTGDPEEARRILKSLEATIPGLAMVRLRRVSLERRHGNLVEAEALLSESMENASTITERSFYAVKLARQHMKVQRNLGQAKKVLLDALESDQVSVARSPAWMAL